MSNILLKEVGGDYTYIVEGRYAVSKHKVCGCCGQLIEILDFEGGITAETPQEALRFYKEMEGKKEKEAEKGRYKIKPACYVKDGTFPYFYLGETNIHRLWLCDEREYDTYDLEDIGLHPDAWDGEEFNQPMILNGKKVRVRSYDFDFV